MFQFLGGWKVPLFFTSGWVSSSNIISFSFAKYSVNLSLRVKLWISFSISIVFLLGVGVNFKPLLKTLTCVSARHVLDKFMTLGWIIVRLFDWCELYPVRETKNYLCLCHLIVDFYLPLVYSLTLLSFFCFFVPDWFNYNHIKSWFVFLLFWWTIEFPKFMFIYLVAVLISWFRWCSVFVVLIIFCILFCSSYVKMEAASYPVNDVSHLKSLT